MKQEREGLGFNGWMCIGVARELVVLVVGAKIADAELRDQATRAAKLR